MYFTTGNDILGAKRVGIPAIGVTWVQLCA
jgi:phosphoglycolate phosphatase-like HAD superfamily hydrolase